MFTAFRNVAVTLGTEPIIRSSDHDEMINGAIWTPKHWKIKDQQSHQQPDLCIPKKGGFYQTWLRSHPELVLAVRSDGMLAAPDETLTGKGWIPNGGDLGPTHLGSVLVETFQHKKSSTFWSWRFGEGWSINQIFSQIYQDFSPSGSKWWLRLLRDLPPATAVSRCGSSDWSLRPCWISQVVSWGAWTSKTGAPWVN